MAIQKLDSNASRIVIAMACALATSAVVLGLWVMSDRNWEQTWKDRVRVETPRGSEKAYVLAWLDQNCEFLPHADVVCRDSLGDIAIVKLAGLQESEVSSYSRVTVRRNDLAAGDRDHMCIYHFFDSQAKVIGHYYLPFHEVVSFERAHELLAAR